MGRYINVQRVTDFKKTLVCVGLFSFLHGCANFSDYTVRGPAEELAKQDEKVFSTPIRESKNLEDVANQVASVKDSDVNTELKVKRTPELDIEQAVKGTESVFIPVLSDKLIERQTYNNMPISGFINEVFGNQLGLNFVIQPSLRNVTDLITLRVAKPITQKSFYSLVTSTLENYGVTTFEQDGSLVFDYSESVASGIPLLVTGDALPEVPLGSRPIFQIYPLQFVNPSQVRNTIYQMFPRQDISISQDVESNSIVLKGKMNLISQVVEAIKVLDRPNLVDMHSIILRPSVNTPSELSTQLQDILTTEGINAGNGNARYPIRFLALDSSEQLIVFSRSNELLSYVENWAKELEVKRQSGLETGLFSYQVKSTQASHIVDVLNQLNASLTQNEALANEDKSVSSVMNTFVVDEQLNTILFSGSGKTWGTALDIIKKLDKPAPSVMVEVILAEILLNESDRSAIEWFKNQSIGSFDLSVQGGGFGTTSGPGLSLTLSRGETNAAMNFFYSNSKSKVRSRPRLMVKSGQQASIDIGSRVPVITSNSQSTSAPGAQVIQQVSYLNTGVLLDIKPTVHATGYVDLEIQQEVSEAVNSTSSTINSPTINNRTLNTVLTLRDGGSVMIGGLITSTNGEGETGIPLLGKLPGIGKLFRGDSSNDDRRELVVMIVPYILNSPQEAEALKDELQEARLKMLDDY